MNRKWVFHLLSVFLLFVLLEGHAFAKDTQIPTPVGDIYVQDFANVLTKDEEGQLKSLGRNLENQTTAQVAVLTVKTIDGRSMAEYVNKAFRQYGIGSKKENNGVLLVLATDDHQVRIEVGYGLEGRIPDGKAGRILDEYAIPYLKDHQPNLAVIKTYTKLVNEVASEYGVKVHDTGNQATTDNGIDFPQWLLIIIVIVLVFLDLKFFGGTLTYFILSILSRGGRGGGSSGGGPQGGGGGSSGGGGAGRGW